MANREKLKTVTGFIISGFKITVDSDSVTVLFCSVVSDPLQTPRL